MSQIHLYLNMVLGTILLFLSMLGLNEWAFTNSEFIRGINWVYLPAGVRLLCTLLFGAPGAVGLLIASWIASFFYFFPDDFVRSFAGGILSALAPYLVYLLARQVFGLRSSLTNLTTVRLLICIVAYAIANSFLHHLWFALQGNVNNLFQGFFVMFLGDLNGALLTIYALKAALWLRSIRSVKSML